MIYIGSARIDENGKAKGGKLGDQKQSNSTTLDTKGEVSEQQMYNHSKGWKVYRPKKVAHANLLADKMRTACCNINIGYDQGNRLSIMSKGTTASVPCECDCSSLVRLCILEATGLDLGNFTTATEKNILTKSGLFESAFDYVSQTKTPVYDGDVLVTKTKGHTAIVTRGSTRIASDTYYSKCNNKYTSLVDALKSIGVDTSLNYRKKIALANGLTSYTGKAKENTELLSLLKKGYLKKP